MSDENQNNPGGMNDADKTDPQIFVNETDSAVVVEEQDRTVLLTKDETIVIDKQPMIDAVPANRPRKVYTGMWGPLELAALGLGLLTVAAAVLLYVLFVIPSNNELAASRQRLATLETEMISARDKYGDISNTELHIAKLVSSVTDFESRYLPFETNGRTALYQRLNSLIVSYGLVNSNGPDYSPLEIIDAKKAQQANEERGKSKYRSFFPGVYVTMTLEGPYQNLRRFIREIETGNEFVIISAVELEPSDSQQADKPAVETAGDVESSGVDIDSGRTMPAAQTSAPRRAQGKTHGTVVSLRMEMAAYFRRPNGAGSEAEVPPPAN